MCLLYNSEIHLTEYAQNNAIWRNVKSFLWYLSNIPIITLLLIFFSLFFFWIFRKNREIFFAFSSLFLWTLFFGLNHELSFFERQNVCIFYSVTPFTFQFLWWLADYRLLGVALVSWTYNSITLFSKLWLLRGVMIRYWAFNLRAFVGSEYKQIFGL